MSINWRFNKPCIKLSLNLLRVLNNLFKFTCNISPHFFLLTTSVHAIAINIFLSFFSFSLAFSNLRADLQSINSFGTDCHDSHITPGSNTKGFSSIRQCIRLSFASIYVQFAIVYFILLFVKFGFFNGRMLL